MAQRHVVYLKRSPEGVTAERILAEVRAVEWDLVAEACEVPITRISEADENMRVVERGTPGRIRFDLHYRPGDQRPVAVDGWESPEIAAGVIAEAIDSLDPGTANYERVWQHLGECVETVSASYGSDLPGELMAPILGSQVCLWLAQRYDGLIRDPLGDWYAPTDGLDLEPL